MRWGCNDMTREEALSVLGLSADAGREDITAAYRELAQMLHPDKYGDSKRLRERAERQMRSINEARDVLLKGVRQTSSHATAASHDDHDARLRAAAAARAQAAETARLTVVAQIRTLGESRSRAVTFLVIGLIGMLISSRMRGSLRLLGFPICSTLAVWGVVDIVNATGQLGVLRRRARELQSDRDAARAVANGEV